jgi:hypothetical protein
MLLSALLLGVATVVEYLIELMGIERKRELHCILY